VGADELLSADDTTFQAAWRQMTVDERNALPDYARTRLFDRYCRLTPWVGDTVRRLERAARRRRSSAEPEVRIDGAALLEAIYDFLGRFVAYPSTAARVAHTLWIAHTHLMDIWESTPRIAFLSPEPASGKTRAIEITESLVPRPIEAINVTPAYLFRKVSDPKGTPTILYDEIDTLFGPRAKGNEEVRAILNAGHRRGATAGRCVVKGKLIETEDLPAYCAVALAGLGNLPDTILSRSIKVDMQRRSPSEGIEPYRRREHAPKGNVLRDQLAAWAASVRTKLADTRPTMPDGVCDRDADIWEPLVAVADVAGGDWPARARHSAVTLVTLAKAATPSLGIRLLASLRLIFGEREAIATNDILEKLKALEDEPWGDLKGRAIDGRRLGNFLRRYHVTSKTVRIGTRVARGYTREDLYDPWLRYLPNPIGEGSNQSSSKGSSDPAVAGVTTVTSVTDAARCPRCAGEGCRWCDPRLR